MDDFCRLRRIDPYHLRRLRYAWLRMAEPIDQALRYLPAEVRGDFRDAFCFAPLELEQRSDSSQDGATRLLFRTSDSPSQHVGARPSSDAPVETVVLRSATGRTTLCISSQSGCAVNCAFCATATLPRTVNLSVSQILAQVQTAAELLRAERRRIRNVVFMGMGEPLQNETAVRAAIELLIRPDLFHFPPRRLLVSTVGLPDPMLTFARQFPQVRLALSLHSARPHIRRQLVPLAHRVSLDALHQALADVNRIQSPRPVMIEYLMIDGLNDSPDDAREMADYLQGLAVHINLIPYNPVAHRPEWRPTSRPDRDRFAAILRQGGFRTTIRQSLGGDIEAACGQLAAERPVPPGPT